MRILVAAIGSLGDVLPFVALGAELQRRGHEVRVYGNGAFERYARDLQLHFTCTSDAAEHEAFLNSPAATDPRKGMQAVAHGVLKWVASSYQIMRADILPGETILVGSTFAFAPRLLQETDAVPTAVIHLAPSLLRSEYMAPRFSPLGHMERMPRLLKRFVWRTLDKRFMDPLYTVPLNRLRATLGLAPVTRVFHHWLHAADLALCMIPDWFASRQPDWPAQLEMTGFPLYDHGGGQPLPAHVSAFLDAGAAPVAFTTGTANASSHAFFAASAEACRQSGLRGILVTADPKQLPATLPDGVIHLDYVPFETLLPRVAAFVHHGGIGSTSQALRAGVPQLIRPMAFDQFDNASRARQLGVAREILPRHYRPERVASELRKLIDDGQLAANCARHAEKLRGSDGIARACDVLIERLAPLCAAPPIPARCAA